MKGDGKTKLARIAELERAMAKIATGTLTLAQCIALAESLERFDDKWRYAKRPPRKPTR